MFIQKKTSRLSKSSGQKVSLKRFISCKVGVEYYAFPMENVERILDEFLTHGKTDEGYGLIRYQGETLTFLDLRHLFSAQPDSVPATHLVVCQNSKGEKMGIPVDEIPRAITLTPEQIQPIPPLYHNRNLPKAVSALITLNSSEELFYLDLDQVVFQDVTPNIPDSIEALLLASMNS